LRGCSVVALPTIIDRPASPWRTMIRRRARAGFQRSGNRRSRRARRAGPSDAEGFWRRV
jgi:hypothetical protein